MFYNQIGTIFEHTKVRWCAISLYYIADSVSTGTWQVDGLCGLQLVVGSASRLYFLWTIKSNAMQNIGNPDEDTTVMPKYFFFDLSRY